MQSNAISPFNPTLEFDQSEKAVVSRRWWLLVAGLLFLFILNLGNRGLNEPDEGRYANIAGEILEAEHGWWEPRMSDMAHYDKPPLIYWLTASCFKLFGENEWAARLPCLMGALLALTGLGWTAYRLYGERIAWWSVLFCGTAGQFWLLARMLTPDMILTGFCTLGVACWAEERHNFGKGWWWIGVLCWTLAWWTKATAALVPLLGLFLGLWLTNDRAGLRALRPLRLVGLVLLLGLPWYVSMVMRHPELENFFLGREFVGRIAGHPDGRRGPIYYHVAISLIAWAPWWPMALGKLFIHWRNWTSQWRRKIPMEGWMVITGLGIFSLLSSKLPTYTLPFAPWAALLSARVLVGGDEKKVIFHRLLAASLSVFIAGFVAVSFIAPHVESKLGVNSSLQEVSAWLQKKHASQVYLDRYMPGMEFYFGEKVFYVMERIPQELPGDQGKCDALGESHFVSPADLPTHLARPVEGDVWFIRYKGKAESPLSKMLGPIQTPDEIHLGDFVLDRFVRPPSEMSSR